METKARSDRAVRFDPVERCATHSGSGMRLFGGIRQAIKLARHPEDIARPRAGEIRTRRAEIAHPA